MNGDETGVAKKSIQNQTDLLGTVHRFAYIANDVVGSTGKAEKD